MKRRKNLFTQIASFEVLHKAYLRARRCKRYDYGTLVYSSNLESELIELRDDLLAGTYHTGKYERFMVYEPKPRLVAALPFRDRVVHHGLCNVIEPIFESQFIHDSYACRVGKGTHKAVDRLQYFLRVMKERRGENVWLLKGDIAKYFPSIDHKILLDIISRSIGCRRTLQLIEEIMDSWHSSPGKGIPIGNLTSQLFANIYLNQLDLFIKQRLRAKRYIRYMDDFVLLGHDKQELHSWKCCITEFLESKLQLRLNSKTNIMPAAQGVNFCGYRTWWSHRLLRKSSVKRMRRKLRAFQKRYAAGELVFEDINASVQSWLGHAQHANTYSLRQKLFGEFSLRKAGHYQ